MSTISREHAQEYTEALAQSVGASWRQIALAKRMGVPKALGLSVEEWVQHKLGGYVRMAAEDRREAIKELKAEGMSNREAAAVLGVSRETVNRDVADTNVSPEAEPTEGHASNGDTNVPPEPVAPLDAVAALAAVAVPVPEKQAHVSNNNGENEWYTPAEYIAAAREAMGSIDTDPASSAIANERVGAAKFFTKAQNGLEQTWNGNVWMNPPYAQPLISMFSEALVKKYEAGEIEQACVLVNNATETTWFAGMAEVCSAVCFPSGRVRFLDPDGNPGAPLQGQAVLYFGSSAQDFAKAFRRFGYTFMGRPVPSA